MSRKHEQTQTDEPMDSLLTWVSEHCPRLRWKGSWSLSRTRRRRWVATNLALLQPGDVIVVQTKPKVARIQLPTLYNHYGVYVGPAPAHPESVVHWWSGEEIEDGQWAARKRLARVRRSDFAQFCGQKRVKAWCREYSAGEADAQEVVVRRAVEQADWYFDEYGPYHFLGNNCEHWAAWCKTGKRVCTQEEALSRNVAAAMTKVAAQIRSGVAAGASPGAALRSLDPVAVPLGLVINLVQFLTEHRAACAGVHPEDARLIGQAVGALGSMGVAAACGNPDGAWDGLRG